MRSSGLLTAIAIGVWTLLVSAAGSYRSVQPLPRVRLEVPAHWQEHRQESDVVYAPPGIDYRAKSLVHGLRVFVMDGNTANVTRQLENLMSSYVKANPGMRTDGGYLVEPGLNRAFAAFSNLPADDPTVRETGWLLVARLANGRWLCLFAVSPEAEKASNAKAFTHIRASLQVRER